MDINLIRKKWLKGQAEITGHARKRMNSRNITIEEITQVILEGEILESYPDDKPFPSGLIMGKIRNNEPLYVVCSLGEDKVHVITTHWLDPLKWLDPKTRREKNHV